MKTISTALLVAAALVAAGTVSSFGMLGGETTAYQDYITDGSSVEAQLHEYEGGPRKWTVGGYYQDIEREVVLEDLQEDHAVWQERVAMGFVGYDLLTWLTVEAMLGTADMDIEGWDNWDSDMMWGLGAQVRVMDYRIGNPLMEKELSYVRCEMEFQYLNCSADLPDRTTLDWVEYYVAVPLSLATVPAGIDACRSVALYAGPAFWAIDGEVTDSMGGADIRENQSLGVIGGLEVVPDDNFTVKLEVQYFEDLSYGASVSFHF